MDPLSDYVPCMVVSIPNAGLVGKTAAGDRNAKSRLIAQYLKTLCQIRWGEGGLVTVGNYSCSTASSSDSGS